MSEEVDGEWEEGAEPDELPGDGSEDGAAGDPRDEAILGPALEAFRRFGFRKCSMEDVAKAAGASRQQLYKFFANKGELFQAAVAYGLEQRLASTMAALSRGTVEMGVVAALEEWVGRCDGGLMGAETETLMAEARGMAGEVVREWESRLVAVLAGAIGESEMGAAFARVEVGAEEVARALYAMARGVRGSCGGREEFRREMGVAVRVLWAVGG